MIDGDSFNVRPDWDWDAPDTDKIAVAYACRALGWRPVPAAPIVRQADGRGAIKIEPDVDAGPVEATAEEGIRSGATVFVSTDHNDIPFRVGVDGRTATVPPSQASLGNAGSLAVTLVDDALTSLGYRRTSPITFEGDTGGGTQRHWLCTAEVRTIADWRDAPTLVRMDSDTADILTRTAATLDIPADELASAWIRKAATDALDRHERWTAPGYLTDHSRIIGWEPDGTPRLKH